MRTNYVQTANATNECISFSTEMVLQCKYCPMRTPHIQLTFVCRRNYHFRGHLNCLHGIRIINIFTVISLDDWTILLLFSQFIFDINVNELPIEIECVKHFHSIQWQSTLWWLSNMGIDFGAAFCTLLAIISTSKITYEDTMIPTPTHACTFQWYGCTLWYSISMKWNFVKSCYIVLVWIGASKTNEQKGKKRHDTVQEGKRIITKTTILTCTQKLKVISLIVKSERATTARDRLSIDSDLVLI